MKEYKIIRVVNSNGIVKYQIHYYIDGVEETINAYPSDIIEGYVLNNNLPIESNLTNITDEDIAIQTPKDVALWKLRAVLNAMGLEQNVADEIEKLPNPPRVGATYIWNYGNSIDRNSNTISFIQNALSLTDTQVNQIFITANEITL